MKAMILAAGRGERMRPLTDHTPKPLLKAAGRPLIEHTLLKLRDAGYVDIVINTAYLGEQIERHLQDGARLGVNILYSREHEALETGGGIRKALPLLGTEPFLLVNGDVATDFPFQDMKSSPSGLAHLLLVANPLHHPSGDFYLDGHQIKGEGSTKLTYSGIGVYRPELFQDKPVEKFALAPLLRAAIATGQVTGQYHGGFWLDVGTLERLQELDQRLSAGQT